MSLTGATSQEAMDDLAEQLAEADQASIRNYNLYQRAKAQRDDLTNKIGAWRLGLLNLWLLNAATGPRYDYALLKRYVEEMDAVLPRTTDSAGV